MVQTIRLLASALLLTAAGSLRAAVDGNHPAGLAAWEWFQEVRRTQGAAGRTFAFLLTPSVFDAAPPDLLDLRLYDSRGHEIPYALRVQRAENRQIDLPARGPFNQVAGTDRSKELTLELEGEGNTLEHNEVEIATDGKDFRRRVLLEGSDTGTSQSWRSLLEKAYVVEYDVAPRPIVLRTLHYPVSRYRYVRVHVFPDASNPGDTFKILKVTVRRTVQVPGRYLTLPAQLGPREAVRGDGGPASAWPIDFGGMTTLCERLSFDIADAQFVRPYRLEMANPDEIHQVIARGDWRRQPGGEVKPIEIEFPETRARRLRLVITDFANPPLNLIGVRYAAAARAIIFAGSDEWVWPLRLYYGNPQALAPEYDFAKNLPLTVTPPPVEFQLGSRTPNPSYQPPPKPLTERWPALVYVVLGAASAVLLGILTLLARLAMNRHDQGTSPSTAPPSPVPTMPL